MSERVAENVAVLPGVNRPDLVKAITPETVLTAAMKENLLDACVVGRSHTGEIVVWSTQTDADAVAGLLTRGIRELINAPQVTESAR
jgi:hypothetical protein